jgi:hypothetical protein
MLLPLRLTGDVNTYLAGFLAIGITMAGFLAFGRRWLAPYLLIGSAIALVLVLVADSYTTFGLVFLLLVVVAGCALTSSRVTVVRSTGEPVTTT